MLVSGNILTCGNLIVFQKDPSWFQQPIDEILSKTNFKKHGSVVVDFLFIVTPIVGVCNCSMFCCTLLYVHSCIAIILMGKRELIALLNLSSWCLVMVERLFRAVPRTGLSAVCDCGIS